MKRLPDESLVINEGCVMLCVKRLHMAITRPVLSVLSVRWLWSSRAMNVGA